VLGPVDYIVWLLSFLLDGFVVVYSLRRGQFLRYIVMNLCMLGLASADVGELIVLRRYGLTSPAYFYFYYYSEAMVTILIYFSIFALYQQVFQEMKASRYIRGASLMLLLGTALVSFQIVHQNETRLTSRFVVELSQNLYFVGVVLTYILWGAVMKLRETRLRVIHFVLSLGVFFSGYAALYAFRNLFPAFEFARRILPPLLSLWLPVTWAYTFWKVPEEARLEITQLVPTHVR
jgi:hypothetical protein